MTVWDFLWNIWENDGWGLIAFVLFFFAIHKVINIYLQTRLSERETDRVVQEDMRRTFDEIRLANSIAMAEIDKLHARLVDTKSLLTDLGKDISNMHHRITRSVRILNEKKKLVKIESDDIQEVIDILENQG